jgi:cell division protein FtsI (penicillin-binding protein 3)
MIRRPLRPLARVLTARAEGRDPNLVEAEERAARLAAMQRAERARAETRLLLLGVAFVLGFSVVAGRMAMLAAAVPVEPRAGAGSAPIIAQRAEIVDRNGAVLATNIVTASLYAQPREMIDPAGTAAALASIFPDLAADELLAQFTDGRKFLWIKRSISPEQRQLVHDLGEPGLLFGPREARLYPNGPLAAHVLGGASYGREGVQAAEVIGTAGVEKVFDPRLRDPARLAEPLRLSLDVEVQAALEDVLQLGMADMRAKGAVGILMEASTGRIRALASLPDFDPNLRPPLPTSGDPADSPLFNRAAQGRYELGSTFKPFTVAMALDAGVVGTQTWIDTKGPMRWGRFTIRDFHDYGPRLTVEDVLVKSSNIGSARIGIEMGGARQKEFLGRLGMLEASPVELVEAGRTAPLLPERWTELTTITISYGHGMAVTPLHLAAGYAALVNGGYRIRPSIIEGAATPPTEADRVISAETSREMRDMLRQVVVRGTAKLAEVKGYEVGGKTGTADKPNATGGYSRDKTISTFAAFFPASAPKYVLVIALDEPTAIINDTEFRTAGLTAAPVVGKAIRRLVPVLGMPPELAPEESAPVLYTLAGNE